MNSDLVSIESRVALLKAFPCFAALTLSQSQELATLMVEKSYLPHDVIVVENELVDSVYLLVKGEAEVTRASMLHKKMIQTPVALLREHEAIGLNDTGFYSATGKRTATVTAITPLLALRLDLQDLYAFLKKHQLESTMYSASQQMLRTRLIKQSLPFSKLSYERLQWLANHVEELRIPAETVLFKQGDAGDKCYLISKGEVEIAAYDDHHDLHQLARLKSPVLFGEATLITHSPRNATATALTECDLLVLSHQHLSELIESENNVAQMFMTLMLDRSRPIKNPHVTSHQRLTADRQKITILKNTDSNTYFKLSEEGFFIWEKLDGKHTMQDITMALADQFNVFAPNVVAALVSKLSKGNFISDVTMGLNKKSANPLWMKMIADVRSLLEKRVAFGDADKWITRLYEKYIRYGFSLPGQLMLMLIIVSGLYAFVTSTGKTLLFFNFNRVNLLLIAGLIPLSFLKSMLHELGHAFAVKRFGREVHYMGVGWYWFSPITFIDTSDMWLSARKQRMLVNLAGIYVDLIVAGLSALLILVVTNPYVEAILWLFALYTYLGAFRMLSPLQDKDGYYALMDWVEKNHLRRMAVIWLMNIFPQALLHPRLFLKYRAEEAYWLACILFLIAVTIITYIVQHFIFTILGLVSINRYLTLVIPFFVLLVSCISIAVDVRSQREE